MRRLIAFAAFLLAISVIPVCAQRGGGHAGGGGSHGGFGGGHAVGGGFSGGHVGGGFAGGHIGGFAGHSGFASHGSMGAGSHAYMGRRYARGGRYYGGHRNGGHGFFDRRYGSRFGYGYSYPYYGYPYYSYLPGIDPYWWWDSYPSDDADQRELANEMNEQNIEEQRTLREEDQDAYARSYARPRAQGHAAQPAFAPEAQSDPKTVLIYRDQHQREVQNYAIVDDVIYVFTSQRTEKVPLAILDIPATQKANEDRGVDFHLPGV